MATGSLVRRAVALPIIGTMIALWFMTSMEY
jgi:hypothetical protein